MHLVVIVLSQGFVTFTNFVVVYQGGRVLTQGFVPLTHFVEVYQGGRVLTQGFVPLTRFVEVYQGGRALTQGFVPLTHFVEVYQGGRVLTQGSVPLTHCVNCAGCWDRVWIRSLHFCCFAKFRSHMNFWACACALCDSVVIYVRWQRFSVCVSCAVHIGTRVLSLPVHVQATWVHCLVKGTLYLGTRRDQNQSPLAGCSTEPQDFLGLWFVWSANRTAPIFMMSRRFTCVFAVLDCGCVQDNGTSCSFPWEQHIEFHFRFLMMSFCENLSLLFFAHICYLVSLKCVQKQFSVDIYSRKKGLNKVCLQTRGGLSVFSIGQYVMKTLIYM